MFEKTYLEKNPSQERADKVFQSVGPEFKPQNHKNNNDNKKIIVTM
jgi:hypothetical protein